MNSLIYYPLGILLIMAIFGIFYNPTNTIIGTTDINTDGFTSAFNGTDSFSFSGTSLILGISYQDGILLSVVAIIAFIGIIGIRVVDTGISEYSVKAITNLSLWGIGIWGMLSILSFDAITASPYQMGWFLWLALTIFYLMGIFKSINSGD